MNPPTEPVPAEEIALVRPYYSAHERDLAQRRAAARLRSWGADLPDPDEARARTTRARTLDEYAAAADTFHVPAPRVPGSRVPGSRVPGHRPPGPHAPAPRMPARVDDLPHLSRLRRRQQERRAGVIA